eukprot:scaffold31954_cov66-Phaeocystis_antarctica.AAC.12
MPRLATLAVAATISSRAALRSASDSNSAAALAFWSHFSAWTFDGEGDFPSGLCGRFPSWLRVLLWHASPTASPPPPTPPPATPRP